MKYYAVIDTNVVVSAMINWESVPGSIVLFAFSDTIVPIFNDEILNEYRTVLLRPKFGLTEDIVDKIISSFIAHGISTAAKEIEVDFYDSKDVVFYQVTMAKMETAFTYLVTGNIKHFPSEPFVVTPREMLDIILADLAEGTC